MNNSLESLDIPAWVAKASADKRNFREAVHIILTAIGQSTALRTKMIMKGGMLMALRYESNRFTKDADFSTRELYIQGNETELIAELDAQLALANAELPYDTSCQIQRFKLKPADKNKTFPTLALNIGYAAKSNTRAINRLMAKQSPTIVQIDYSYNESVLDVEVLQLVDGAQLRTYSLVNLMAEKYRSLLQQTIRQRNRRQDIYDLALLLNHVSHWTQAERDILKSLIMTSAQSKGIQAQADSMSDPKIREMAAKGYEELAAEIDGPLPTFEDTYQQVLEFYESLPWSNI
jgi:predicted nucleotidyltransferase component of viral defense system